LTVRTGILSIHSWDVFVLQRTGDWNACFSATPVLKIKLSTFFVPSELDLDLEFAPLVTFVQRYFSLDEKFLRLYCFEKIEGTEQTARRTGCNT